MWNNSWYIIINGLFILGGIFLINNCIPYIFSNINGMYGWDVIAFGLILLSFWICGLIILASQGILKIKFNRSIFLFIVLLLIIMLYLTFRSIDLFIFYLFFESSLIPTFLLILGWGYQPERVQAGIYLLFYTLLASLPLLVSVFYIYTLQGNLFIPILGKYSISGNFLFYLTMVGAFLVKIPIFLVHLWLPKAHVEAPVRGSIILAGVLLKLGGYGLLRVLNLLSILGLKFNIIWIGVSLVGGCLVRFICLRQTDLKALVAYSSVAHMGLVLGGLLTINYWGICGAYTLIIAHGLCSSGLFCLTNIRYERLGSRRLIINKGLMHFIPRITLWWFLLRSANIAAPPTLNLLGEITLLNSLVGWCWVSIIMLILLSFFRAAYTLYLYSYSQHGKFFTSVYSCVGGYTREYLLLFLHWVPLNLLIIKSEAFILWIYLNSL